MNNLTYNLKIAARNLNKYRLQTAISVLSIAVGIVTLSMVHSIMQSFKTPAICDEPYYDRACRIYVDSVNGTDGEEDPITMDVLRAVKRDGGLRAIEGKPMAPNGMMHSYAFEFKKGDTLRRNIDYEAIPVDGAYPNYVAYRSAITGKKVAVMKKGEAIMPAKLAEQVFGTGSPIGATFDMKVDGRKMTFTVTDVFEKMSQYDGPPDTRALYYCVGDLEDYELKYRLYMSWIDVIKKEGCTLRQIQDEVDARLKPLGLKSRVKLVRDEQKETVSMLTFANIISRLIGSLVLLAAVIGFLRMQTQLFWMRRREIAIRTVNGARRRQLFATLMTEVVLTLTMAALLAVAAGVWVEDFCNTKLVIFMKDSGLDIGDLWLYSIVITVALAAVCAVIVWMTLHRICRSEAGLAASMRRSGTNWFRNIMLGVQIFVSMFFVCGTLELVNWAEMMKSRYALPDDDSVYKRSILVRNNFAEDPKQLHETLAQLPAVERMVITDHFFYDIFELSGNDNLVARRNGQKYYDTLLAADTAFIDFYQTQVKWFKRKVDRGNCLLVQEDLYDDMRKVGLANLSSLTLEMNEWTTLPVAGTFTRLPYDRKGGANQTAIVMISPNNSICNSEPVLVAKDGRYDELMRDVKATTARLEPTVANNMVFNYYEYQTLELHLYNTMSTLAWILAIVSLMVCVMSIYSTITLDTRARRKEVAIRKINGADTGHIAGLFGRLYIMLIVPAVLVTVPAAMLFNEVVMTMGVTDAERELLSPVLPIIIGIISVIVVIALIVGRLLKGIMNINPTEVIAKE